jgi:hypothetical protein
MKRKCDEKKKWKPYTKYALHEDEKTKSEKNEDGYGVKHGNEETTLRYGRLLPELEQQAVQVLLRRWKIYGQNMTESRRNDSEQYLQYHTQS